MRYPLQLAAKKFRDWRFPDTVEIAVSKGWCTPARDTILTALAPYGIVVHDIGEDLIPDPEHPAYIDAYVRVNPQAAEWAEYILLRTGKLGLLSTPINPRNLQWAAQHDGKMPTPWRMLKGERWIESGCSSKGADEYRKRHGSDEPEPPRDGRTRPARRRPSRTRRTSRTRS